MLQSAPLTRIPRKEIIFSARDWKGREVILLKTVLKQHVSRFHVDEVLILDTLKKQLAVPRVVVENPGAKSEQAIYDIPSGGHPCLLVAIKYKRVMGRWFGNLIATLYGIQESQIPPGKVLYGNRNPPSAT